MMQRRSRAGTQSPSSAAAVDRRAYLVGGGIASLAAAAYLLKEGGFKGSNITIFEETEDYGGGLEVRAGLSDGCSMRGGRMFEQHFHCTHDLLSFIPAVDDPARSALDELRASDQEFFSDDRLRLVSGGEIVDVSELEFAHDDRVDLIRLCTSPEALLGRRTIEDCFRPEFFQSGFWLIWSIAFAFEPWHSAVEFRRYCLRFAHLFSAVDSTAGIYRTRFNQFDAVVRPLLAWLTSRGVRFQPRTEVVDIELELRNGEKLATAIVCRGDGGDVTIPVAAADLVFVTNGSMAAGTSYGSTTAAPVIGDADGGGSWRLWRRLAGKSPDFGAPEVFSSQVERTKWECFTVTAGDSTFIDRVQELCGSPARKGGLITLKDSNWLLTLMPNQAPHHRERPDDVWVWWGYGLFPDRVGNFVAKKMSECTGAEILQEVLHHLHFDDAAAHVLASSTVVPAIMPFITAQFMPRSRHDRPQVIPDGSVNLAFIGQFVEIPDDFVFTVEYSVRAAQTAVFGLLEHDRRAFPLDRDHHDPHILLDGLRVLHRRRGAVAA